MEGDLIRANGGREVLFLIAGDTDAGVNGAGGRGQRQSMKASAGVHVRPPLWWFSGVC